MQNLYKELVNLVGIDNVKVNEAMSKHTSIKIGGPADFFVTVLSINDIKNVIEIARKNEVKFKVIGNGTNILVSDKGFRGIVIKIALNKIDVKDVFINAEAGALLSRIARIALENSLSGMENLSGIPGTIGGAVTMNARSLWK